MVSIRAMNSRLSLQEENRIWRNSTKILLDRSANLQTEEGKDIPYSKYIPLVVDIGCNQDIYGE